MEGSIRVATRTPAPVAVVVTLIVSLLAVALAAGAGVAVAKESPVAVKLKTKGQAALFDAGKLKVRVRSATRGKVRLDARRGKARRLTERRTVIFKRAGKRRVGLKLTAKGRRRLGACGEQRVVVRARYRLGRKGVAKRKRTLAQDPVRCVENLDRCDPIDSAHCLLPYPNNYFTVADGASPTGLRLNLSSESMPTNLNGTPAFDPALNRNDGFSPTNVILARVPGIETPQALRANGLVPQMDIGAYADPDQRVVLINAATGERQPIWTEVDMVPGTPNPHDGNQVQGTDDDRMLMIHPAVALDYGTRYLVALRDLHDLGGQPLEPNPVFEAYRKGRKTGIEAIDARLPAMKRIFDELQAAGIARESLYLAWDFTVASERNLTGGLVAMRDDAFAQLSESELDDGGDVDGRASEITIDEQIEYALCDSDGTPQCELDVPAGETPQSDYVFKKVTGEIEVPCYMDAPGPEYNPIDPSTPCASGSRLHFEPGAQTPSQPRDGSGPVTWRAPFTCVIPRSARGAPTMATGKPGVVFGHGLFQNHRVVEQLGLFPAALEGVACGTDWIGLSAIDPVSGDLLPHGDLLGHLANMIAAKQDLSLFAALPDRSQQGYVNTLYLARAMAHPGGFAEQPEFADGGASALGIDPDDVTADLAYYGVSLGGIHGAATTSVAPDWSRAVLGVPGIGFTTLLTRSTQFNRFLPLIYDAYPDPLARQLGTSILQLYWDRGEPSAYAHGILDGRYGTPEHQVMIHEAFGDHQVANVQTETLARTLGAEVRVPTVAGGRPESRPYLFSSVAEPFYAPGQELVESAAFNRPGGLAMDAADAVAFTIDTGPLRSQGGRTVGTLPNPDWNIAPVDAGPSAADDGLDPHESAATSPAAQQSAMPFLLGQGVYDPCVDGAPGPAEMPPWTVPYSGTPSPCSAPPLHEPGQGE
jgi:hypothetical protein